MGHVKQYIVERPVKVIEAIAHFPGTEEGLQDALRLAELINKSEFSQKGEREAQVMAVEDTGEPQPGTVVKLSPVDPLGEPQDD